MHSKQGMQQASRTNIKSKHPEHRAGKKQGMQVACTAGLQAARQRDIMQSRHAQISMQSRHAQYSAQSRHAQHAERSMDIMQSRHAQQSMQSRHAEHSTQNTACKMQNAEAEGIAKVATSKT